MAAAAEAAVIVLIEMQMKRRTYKRGKTKEDAACLHGASSFLMFLILNLILSLPI